MANFHRRTTPTYFGGLPGGYDLINTPADASVGGTGVPAFTDPKKVGGPNDGTYFVAFGEDATSKFANRGLDALAVNTDFLDNLFHRDLAAPTRTADVTVGGSPLASVVITGNVFVGASGTTNTADHRERLVSALDANDQEIIDSSGNTVVPSLIHDGASVSVVGVPASGFYTNPTVNFSPSIPAGTTYRLYYGVRSNLATMPVDVLTDIAIRAAQEVDGLVERQLRNLHAPSNLQAWDAAWDSTIRALAASGLNERYRRQTGVPGSFTFDTPGDGATIVRDGRAVTVQAADITVGTTVYPDPALALYRALSGAAPAAGGGWPNMAKGGDVGYWHETDVNGSNTASEVSRPGPSGPGYLDVVPRSISSGTLTTQALFYINASGTATLNPDSDGSAGGRETLQCAAGQYFRVPSGGDAGKTGIRLGLDLVEVTKSGVTTTYVIADFLTATRIICHHMNGRQADFGATAASANIRILQTTISLGGSASRGNQNVLDLAVFAPPANTQVGGDPGFTRLRPPKYIAPSAAFSEPPTASDTETAALYWGYHDITTGLVIKTGQLRGDGQIRTYRGAWSISVGDGVSTFGDFNGSTAITDAVTYLNTLFGAGTWSATIYAKRGQYSVIGLGVVSGQTVKIVGDGADQSLGTRLVNATAGNTVVITNGTLMLEDLYLQSAQGVIKIGNGSTGSGPRLLTKNCQILAPMLVNSPISDTDLAANLAGAATIHGEDTYFTVTGGFGASGDPILDITPASGSAGVSMKGIRFERCKFLAVANSPVVRLDASSTNGIFIDDLVFSDCRIQLSGSTGALENNTNNSGVIRISSSGPSDHFSQIRGIKFDHCDVIAHGFSGKRPCLLYLQATELFRVLSFEIDGGRWLVDSAATVFDVNPFTILPLSTGNDGYGTLAITTYGKEPVVKVSIEGATVGYGVEGAVDQLGASPFAGKYGSIPTEQSSLNGGNNITTVWGAWVVRAETIDIKAVKFIGTVVSSSLPELEVFATRRLGIDGFEIQTPATSVGTGSVPKARVSIVSGASAGTADVKKVVCDLNGFSAIDSTGSILAVSHAVASEPGGAPIANGYVITVDGCLLGNSNGIGYSVAYGIVTTGNHVEDLNLIVLNCNLYKCSHGVSFGGADPLPNRLIVKGNKISGHSSWGVVVVTDTWELANCIVIEGNVISSCGAEGIYCIASAWATTPGYTGIASDGVAGPTIVGNRLLDNTSTNNVQIRVGDATVDHPGGLIVGNDCTGTGVVGAIRVLAPATTGKIYTAGIGTAITGATVAVPVTQAAAAANDERMLQNNARWRKT